MKFLLATVTLLGLSLFSYSQQVYQIRADSVRIYSGCDTAELILENHTQNVPGVLYNKGRGRTEFRKLDLTKVGDSAIAIAGIDTLTVGKLGGGGTNIYNADGVLTGDRMLNAGNRTLSFSNLSTFTASTPSSPTIANRGSLYVQPSIVLLEYINGSNLVGQVGYTPQRSIHLRLNSGIDNRIFNLNGNGIAYYREINTTPPNDTSFFVSNTGRILTKYKNNSTEDSVLTTDINGNIKFRKVGAGGDGSWTANGNNIYNVNTGNVGIGTNTPAAKLDVNGAVKVQQISLPSPDGSGVGNVYSPFITVGSNSGDTLLKVANSSILFGLKRTISEGFASSIKNTAFGNNALRSITSGQINTAIGTNALASNTTGSQNIAIGGEGTLVSNTTGDLNVAIGVNALKNNKTSSGNIAMGWWTLTNANGGINNTAIGNNALEVLTTGSSNIALGSNAGNPHTGHSSIFIGNNTSTTGNINDVTIVGNAMIANIPAVAVLGGRNQNVIIGHNSVDGDGFGIVNANSGDKLQVNGTVKIGGSLKVPIATESADVFLTPDYHTVLMNNTSDVNVFLPAAADNTGTVFFIKKISNNTSKITLLPDGVDTIEGDASYIINTYKRSIQIQSNGTAWYILTSM